jgi:pimeloyl-ACP methyl ester carboxylesterase
MFELGKGTPIVLIPGLQGRWEWMRPAVDALARQHRVITFSLCDERTSPFPCDLDRAFDNYVSQVNLALDRAGIDRAVIAGVSYGAVSGTGQRAGAGVGAARLVGAESTAAPLSRLAAVDEPDVPGHRARTDALGNDLGAADDHEAAAILRSARPARRPCADDTVENGAPDRMGEVTSLCRSSFRDGAGADRHR